MIVLRYPRYGAVYFVKWCMINERAIRNSFIRQVIGQSLAAPSKFTFRCLLAISLSLSPFWGASAYDDAGDQEPIPKKSQPLEGEVQEEGIAPARAGPVAPKEPLAQPVIPRLKEDQGTKDQPAPEKDADAEDDVREPLKARVQRSELKGEEDTDDRMDDNLSPRRANAVPDDGRLKGREQADDDGLVKEDPDAQDQDLQVEWDKWRNRFLRAVLSNCMDNINNPEATDFRWDPVRRRVMNQFPLGTISWFSCQITNTRHIRNLRIDKSSGYPNYDRAVLDAVQSLDGTSLLKFPSRSHRTMVSQNGGVKTSDTSQQQYFKFGDVEHVHIPGNQ
jgi:hypothetical protein